MAKNQMKKKKLRHRTTRKTTKRGAKLSDERIRALVDAQIKRWEQDAKLAKTSAQREKICLSMKRFVHHKNDRVAFETFKRFLEIMYGPTSDVS